MAQGYGQYNQFGGYGQIPGQADQTRFPRFGGGQGGGQQYPQGTFQGQQGSQPQQNSSNLSQPPPTGSPNPPASSSSSAQPPSQATPSPPPVSSGAAGQQAPDTQYPAGTFPASTSGTTSLYGGSMGTNSTGPVNMMLGQFGAPGAWDGGYNPYFAPPAASAQTGPAPTPVAPVSTSQPAATPPMPTGGTWGDQAHLDYFRQYGAGNSGLSQEQVNALLGQSSQPSAATAAYNQAQQQFTQNNQGYAATGYLGNQAQVLSQLAGGAQSAGIPLGVLGPSFYQGGADYGGQQNAGNSMSGNNGATDWTGSTYGINPATPEQMHNATAALAAARARLGQYPTGTFR